MRAAAFVIVGALGFVVQIAALAALLAAGCPYLIATAAAVEVAVLHNFAWHERWTWADRTSLMLAGPHPRSLSLGGAASRRFPPAPRSGSRRSGRTHFLKRLVRFNLSTGATSIFGNVMFMAVYVDGAGLHPLAANALAVASTALVNFVLADRWVFSAAAITLAVLTCATDAFAAPPTADTLAAWNAYVKAFEDRLERTARDPIEAVDIPQGETIAAGSGLIHRWRATVLLRGVTVDRVVDMLMNPGTPPPQEDVVASRVLARSPNTLRVYLRLMRTSIVTVVYDTEHDVTFDRRSAALATSRSIATKIAEVEGAGTARERELPAADSRGFLWRLNSYWRYAQVRDGVLVELDSLTLSRDVPAIVRPIAAPLISRVARSSVAKTLRALSQWCESRVMTDQQAAR
jgi:putative flippase GtrA